MSCDYFVHCVDCSASLPFTMPSYDRFLGNAIIAHRAAIAGLGPLLIATLGNLQLGNDRQRIDPQWFLDHQGHALVVIDEYGRVNDRCGEHYTCDRCETSHFCNLPKGHPSDQQHSGRI